LAGLENINPLCVVIETSTCVSQKENLMGIGSRKFKGSEGFLRNANPDNYVTRERVPTHEKTASDQATLNAPTPHSAVDVNTSASAIVAPSLPTIDTQNVTQAAIAAAVTEAVNQVTIAAAATEASISPGVAPISEEELLDFVSNNAKITYDDLKVKFGNSNIVVIDGLLEKLQSNSAILLTNLENKEYQITDIGKRAQKYLKLAKL
jgi:hypothetical protein